MKPKPFGHLSPQHGKFHLRLEAHCGPISTAGIFHWHGCVPLLRCSVIAYVSKDKPREVILAADLELFLNKLPPVHAENEAVARCSDQHKEPQDVA
jgi:hypothetical protein